ncbi:KAP family NTPase [Shewanella sp. SW36]|uniref:KAP family P-loop NTPase fold protein n=1 Tax=unclassified Shewanella TaxID=196818 RepID=UPI0021D9E2E0|nr:MULTISPECIES: KAP family NTPase [unclassified Shewanella]MCU7963988.1 KAP family NTPase [Shewanella sp. SW32]MCU7971805.1 KAP family NTPase [Shewanella sp. SW29]MCU7977046.1 KAP family NTPase [Shewanella sp. SW36]MCU7992287.1 KAP family NTPase [Shewanella sp. SW1]MCU8053729.1 KAP family NTPase [Shewanella sp. SM43]
MTSEVKLDWSEPKKIELGDGKFESLPADKLQRQEYADFIADFLSKQGFEEASGDKKNYVLNLNAEWGSGKTYFLRRLSEDLKVHHPVVYLDAWKQDYSEDPLMTVVSSMISQLKSQARLTGVDENTFEAPKKLLGLLKAAAPSIVGAFVKRYGGFDPIELWENSQTEDVPPKSTADAGSNKVDMSATASQMVKELLRQHEDKSEAIESIKLNVENWVEAVVGLDTARDDYNRKYPAFVFIDELDRCRPSYAVEMLEVIKHIFDIAGVVFIVATDTAQLQHAVKAIYGEGFDARTYLSRFFNSRFTLKQPTIDSLIYAHCDCEKLSGQYIKQNRIVVWPECESYEHNISNINSVISCFGLPARTIIQITDRIIAILGHMKSGSKVDLLMLTALMSLREKNEDVYEAVISYKFGLSKWSDGNRVKLNRYLTQNYDFKNRNIMLNVDSNVPYDSLLDQSLTQYPDAVYKANLSHYMKDIFSIYLKSVESGYTGNGGIGRHLSTNIPLKEKLAQKVCTYPANRNSHEDEDTSNAWLDFYHSLYKLEDVDITYYQNLIELASALEWDD